MFSIVIHSTGREESAQLCVYVGEDKVIIGHWSPLVTDQWWTIIDDDDGDDYDDVDGDDGGGNDKVVDLWGSSSSSYTADTLTNVFSR